MQRPWARIYRTHGHGPPQVHKRDNIFNISSTYPAVLKIRSAISYLKASWMHQLQVMLINSAQSFMWNLWISATSTSAKNSQSPYLCAEDGTPRHSMPPLARAAALEHVSTRCSNITTGVPQRCQIIYSFYILSTWCSLWKHTLHTSRKCLQQGVSVTLENYSHWNIIFFSASERRHCLLPSIFFFLRITYTRLVVEDDSGYNGTSAIHSRQWTKSHNTSAGP